MSTIYLLIILSITCGEYEFSSKTLHSIPGDCDPEAHAEEYAKTFYFSKSSEDIPGLYYFHGGSVAVSVESVTVLSKDHYDILSKYF